LESSETGEVKLCVSYQVTCCGWYPIYDIRVRSDILWSIDEILLTYRGCVYQNCDEDWVNASLKLSTAQPCLSGIMPELGSLQAIFHKPTPPPSVQPTHPFAMKCTHFGSTTPLNTGVSESVMSTIFDVPTRKTIFSGSGEHKITFALLDFDSVMVHQTIPNKNTNVYLVASAINDSPYPLLSGSASVYFDNSFIAQTRIKSVSPGERFQCSLGVDPAVKVEYKPAYKYSEQAGLISKSSLTFHEQKIIIKNTKKDKILLMLTEYVPKSTDERIKLISPELDVVEDKNMVGKILSVGRRINADNNLEWTLSIAGKAEANLLVKWSIDYPSTETIEYKEYF
uniref:DUF4139 domain-containing protein n=1 Tax=Dracunculus medinensis TaxID=318479 RepID=A0A0N4U9B3_DRAME